MTSATSTSPAPMVCRSFRSSCPRAPSPGAFMTDSPRRCRLYRSWRAVQFRTPRRSGGRRRQGPHGRDLFEGRTVDSRPQGTPSGQLPPARLGHFAPALLGLPDPGHPLRHLRHGAGARSRTCRSCCPTTSPSTVQATRSTIIRPGSMSPARNAVSRPGAKPTRWTRSSIRPGILPASPRRGRSCRRFRADRQPGCRSTSISAASSTRSCTCSIRASSPAP